MRSEGSRRPHLQPEAHLVSGRAAVAHVEAPAHPSVDRVSRPANEPVAEIVPNSQPILFGASKTLRRNWLRLPVEPASVAAMIGEEWGPLPTVRPHIELAGPHAVRIPRRCRRSCGSLSMTAPVAARQPGTCRRETHAIPDRPLRRQRSELQGSAIPAMRASRGTAHEPGGPQCPHVADECVGAGAPIVICGRRSLSAATAADALSRP